MLFLLVFSGGLEILLAALVLIDLLVVLRQVPHDKRHPYIIVFSLYLIVRVLGVVSFVGAITNVFFGFGASSLIFMVIFLLYTLKWRRKLVKILEGQPDTLPLQTSQNASLLPPHDGTVSAGNGGAVAVAAPVISAKRVHAATSIFGSILTVIAVLFGLFTLAVALFLIVIFYQCSRPGAKCM